MRLSDLLSRFINESNNEFQYKNVWSAKIIIEKVGIENSHWRKIEDIEENPAKLECQVDSSVTCTYLLINPYWDQWAKGSIWAQWRGWPTPRREIFFRGCPSLRANSALKSRCAAARAGRHLIIVVSLFFLNFNNFQLQTQRSLLINFTKIDKIYKRERKNATTKRDNWFSSKKFNRFAKIVPKPQSGKCSSNHLTVTSHHQIY